MKRLLFIILLVSCLGIRTMAASAQDTAGTCTPVSDRTEVEVRGRLLDIRQAERWTGAYPQCKGFRFGKSLPESLEGKSYAVSLKELPGPEEVRADKPCIVTIALCGTVPDDRMWRETGERFHINDHLYTVYAAEYDTPGQWMPLPAPEGAQVSAMLFADSLRIDGTEPVPGTVIARAGILRKSHITNPNIVILPDGGYLAACSGVTSERSAVFFRSDDKGKTWNRISWGHYPINFYTVFVHEGILYMLGTKTPEGDIIICRSDDCGRTWTFPDADGGPGLLFRGRYHSAPVPVVHHDGRIWKAMETNWKGEQRRAFVISAPEDSDLMSPDSWKMSRQLDYSQDWPVKGVEGRFRQWIEGNIVVMPDGSLANLLRVDEHEYGRTAAIVHVDSPSRLSFDPEKDIIEMPGGGKKFTVRYDPLSGKYWSLVSAVSEKYRGMAHEGIYSSGIHCGLIRNRLVLISSEDVYHWKEEAVIIESDNPFFDGFQYVDWQFDGDDLISVIRLAMEEERGLPQRQHDANFLVFLRIPDFRTGNYSTIHIDTFSN